MVGEINLEKQSDCNFKSDCFSLSTIVFRNLIDNK